MVKGALAFELFPAEDVVLMVGARGFGVVSRVLVIWVVGPGGGVLCMCWPLSLVVSVASGPATTAAGGSTTWVGRARALGAAGFLGGDCGGDFTLWDSWWCGLLALGRLLECLRAGLLLFLVVGGLRVGVLFGWCVSLGPKVGGLLGMLFELGRCTGCVIDGLLHDGVEFVRSIGVGKIKGLNCGCCIVEVCCCVG